MSNIGEQKLGMYAQMANLVGLILPFLELSLKEIAQNFSKLSCNAHTVCDSELRLLGTGLYPVVSAINHSCLPNSVLTFDGKMAFVLAIKSITKYTEVTLSFIETAASTTTWLKVPEEQYLFICKCPLCIKVQEELVASAVFEGYHCKVIDCDGFLLLTSGCRGETVEALQSFSKAVDILRITHGTSSPFMKELLSEVDEARPEAAAKHSFQLTSD